MKPGHYEFFDRCLREIRAAMPAVALAGWLRNEQGYLQLQAQIGINEVGIDRAPNGRAIHNELLCVAFHSARPHLLEPYDRSRFPDAIAAKNLTDFTLIIAPLLLSSGVGVGLLEAWQTTVPDRQMKQECVEFLVQYAGTVVTRLRRLSGNR